MDKNMSFEQACQNLQTIVDQIESGEVSLEKSIELFEQGQKLIQFCYETLSKTKGKLSEIKLSIDKLEEI